MNHSKQFTPHKPLETPILFLTYNRIETTKKVFDVISKVKPTKLYVASDGPKRKDDLDKRKVESVRDYIIKNISWNCEVKTLFREENLGCRYAVASAITWFFENEDSGIILEDDTLPSLSFFWFCEELLKRYQNEPKVWHIGGTSFLDDPTLVEYDYFFSIFSISWGWATWADRWMKYDVDLNFLDEKEFGILLRRMFSGKSEIKHWMRIFRIMKSGRGNTWDYQWMFTMWYHGGLSILPKYNLVTNIGIGPESTHVVPNPKMVNRPRYEFYINSHPEIIEPNNEADKYIYKYYLGPIPLKRRIYNKLRKIYYKFLTK